MKGAEANLSALQSRILASELETSGIDTNSSSSNFSSSNSSNFSSSNSNSSSISNNSNSSGFTTLDNSSIAAIAGGNNFTTTTTATTTTSNNISSNNSYSCFNHSAVASGNRGVQHLNSSIVSKTMAPPGNSSYATTNTTTTATTTTTFLPQTAFVPGLDSLGLDTLFNIADNCSSQQQQYQYPTHPPHSGNSTHFPHTHSHPHSNSYHPYPTPHPHTMPRTGGAAAAAETEMFPLSNCTLPNIISMHTNGAGGGGSGNSSSTEGSDFTLSQMDKARARQIKAALRKERNKEAARRSNMNKKILRLQLEQRSTELWEENIQLNQDIQGLSKKLRHFESMCNVMQHVCQYNTSSCR